MRKLAMIALCMLGTLAWALPDNTQEITVNAEELETLLVTDGDGDSTTLTALSDAAQIKNSGGNYFADFITELTYTTNAASLRKIVATVSFDIPATANANNVEVTVLAFTATAGTGPAADVVLSDTNQNIITSIGPVADATADFTVRMAISDSPIRVGAYKATITYTFTAQE